MYDDPLKSNDGINTATVPNAFVPVTIPSMKPAESRIVESG